MPYSVCNNKSTRDHVYYNPESLEKQGQSSFFQGKNGHIRSVMIGIAHEVASGSGPDFFQSFHSRFGLVVLRPRFGLSTTMSL